MTASPERAPRLGAGSESEGNGSVPMSAAIVVIMIGRNRTTQAPKIAS